MVNCTLDNKLLTASLGMIFLSYPQVDDRAGPWNTAINAACVLHITTTLLHRSCDFYCFTFVQGRLYHLAPLTSLWHHDLSPDMHSATDRRSLFRNLFVNYIINRSFLRRLLRRFAAFGCWIQISYFSNLNEMNFAEFKRK